MLSLPHSSIQGPRKILLIAALVTLAAAAGLPRLKLRTGGQALVPAAAPEVRYDRAIRGEFGVRDPIVVLISSADPDGIFNPVTLRLVRDLTTDFLGIDGVRPEDVLSLATELSFRWRRGTLRKRTFLEQLPETAGEIAQLRDDLRRIELYDGTLVARDAGSTAILIGAPEGSRLALCRRIRELAARALPPGNTVEVIGAPVAEALLGNHIFADLGVPASVLDESGGAHRPGKLPASLSELRSLPGRTVGLVPIAIAVMGCVFLVSFRRPAAALLPLAEAGCCLVIVFGVMGWLGVPIYLTTAILPVILTAVGVADEIHIFRRFLELHRGRPGAAAADDVRATMAELTSPVVKTSVTTALGFLSFGLSPLVPVRSLGLFAAFGVIVCMLWSLTVVPASLVLIPSAWWVRPRREGAGDRLRRFSTRLAVLAFRRRWLVLAIAVLAAGLALDGARRVVVQDSWIDGFDPESAFARATRRFEEQFLGSHVLLVTVDAEAPRLAGEVEAAAVDHHQLTLAAPPGLDPERLEGSWVRVARPEDSVGVGAELAGRQWSSWIASARRENGRLVVTMPREDGSPRFWLRPRADERLAYEIRSQPLMIPATLHRIEQLEAFLAGRPGVGGVLGPAKYLATAGFMTAPDREGSRRIPATPDLVRILWHNYTVVRGAERLRQLVEPDYSRALTAVFLRDSNYVATRRLMAEIRSWERVHLAAYGIELGFAGDVAVSRALIDAVVTTQLRSVVLALAGILAVAAILGRSLRWGLFSVIPPAFAVLLNFAAMGWIGIPLGVATSMFAGMTLGVGVDFSIHLLARYERARTAGVRGSAAVVDALAATGPAILIDGLAVGLGFAVMVLSQVPANARLGSLLVMSVLHCVVATLVIVPALLAFASGTSDDARVGCHPEEGGFRPRC
ncbi:MAG: MMPL family transporter [bacterium]|nr:MMPL family transporter [bacterium]